MTMPDSRFATMRLAEAPTAVAPDGSSVRPLFSLAAGSVAHFQLDAGQTSWAVTHRTVEEIWYVTTGRGDMWRKQDRREETVALEPGICLTIPAGTHFQFRAAPSAPLTIVAITMPPWPGEAEAVMVPGPWTASVSHESHPANETA